MIDRLICERCDERKLPIYPEEHKEEETHCSYCPHNSRMFAECLVKGKPSCANCKINQKSQTKSPASSLRSGAIEFPGTNRFNQVSDKRSMQSGGSYDEFNTPLKSPSSISAMQEITTKIEKSFQSIHSRRSSQVQTEFLKANNFLTKYVSGSFHELTVLYDSQRDAYSSNTFHAKCDDSKGGIIIVISLGGGYEIAAFSWKGIRKGCPENSDVQIGGAIIKNNDFEFHNFQDQFVINEPEGVRFSRKSDLYLNFDNISASICNFDKKLANNPNWTNWIQEISVYKLS